MSNNTVVCSDIKDLPESFWTAYKGNAGECLGLVNLEAARKYGRYGDERYPDPDVAGVNPCCVPGEVTILTRKGPVAIKDLVNTATEVWNGEQWSLVTPQLKGVKSRLVHVQLEDGRDLTCTPEHSFIIQRGNVQVRVPAEKLQTGEQLAHFPMPTLARGAELIQPAPTSVQRVTSLSEVADVYCFTESSQGRGTFNGIVTGQSEQTLNNYETCALAEIFLPPLKTKQELLRCCKYLYRAVKHSLAIPCSIKETEEVVHKNMRMGIGVTGYLQANEEQRSWLKEVYEELRAYDIEYSAAHDFPTSIKLTAIKPSGSLSLLPGVTPGCHPGYAQYMIRRIQIAADSPLISLIKSHGYHVEYRRNFDGSNDLTTMVAEFPYAYPEGTVLAKDMTAVQQLDVVRRLQREWSDNAVSCTVYFRKEELPEIRQYLEQHWHEMKAVSFLLHQDHGFAQAPYEEISKERYDELVSKTRLITSLEMATIGSDEPDYGGECAGGSCPIR
jgi:ribonucleotide reductase alpha subunit